MWCLCNEQNKPLRRLILTQVTVKRNFTKDASTRTCMYDKYMHNLLYIYKKYHYARTCMINTCIIYINNHYGRFHSLRANKLERALHHNDHSCFNFYILGDGDHEAASDRVKFKLPIISSSCDHRLGRAGHSLSSWQPQPQGPRGWLTPQTPTHACRNRVLLLQL